MKIKILIASSLLLALTACGYKAKDSELIGQPKKVMNNTPLLCSSFTDADISLGVIRNGIGSMSTEDMWLNIENKKDLETIKEAIDKGQLVKIHYDTFRVAFCQNDKSITSVEIVK